MSTPALPPNPSLVAIVLVTKTRRGVKRIFHYPPNPGKERPHLRLDHEHSSEDETTSSDDSDSYSSLEDEPGEGSGLENSKILDPELDDPSSVSPEKDSDGAWRQEDRYSKRAGFLGLPDGIESFLCPHISQHKKRFEMTIDQLVFLGWPVFAKEDGEWKRKRRSRGQRDPSQPARKMSTISEAEFAAGSRRGSEQTDELLGETTGADTEEEGEDEDEAAPEDEANEAMAKLFTLEEENVKEDEEKPQRVQPDLSMFHVVFVMNPPPLEYQLRVDEMYRHVVKKFSRALKWEQSRSYYVQKECEKLKSLKAKHESLVNIAIHSSSLAKAIATVFDAISTSRIAHVDLTTHLQFSLQIPIPTSISHLPDLTSPRLPGLWLTTSTSIPSNDELHNTRSKLASHFALLLLTDLPSILADITLASSPISGPLKTYLHFTTPTKSFLQISQLSKIPLPDIHFLASHLIYWRRARAVPPLHQRDIYIVSPNADMRKLRSASAYYARLFPAQLPSLPKMLSLMSTGPPRPWSTFIPSKSHKPAFFDVLAWLLRGGWATQLRTFAWVRVPPGLQAIAAEEMANGKGAEGEKDIDEEEGAVAEKGADDKEDGSEVNNDDLSGPGPGDLRPGALSPFQASGVQSPASESSARTAIPLGMTSSTGSLLPDVQDKEKEYRPKLVLQPTKASGIESTLLAVIAREIEESQGKEVREAWEVCVKYFNGEHALEKIAVREGWKRKRVEALRQGWVRIGVLCEVRHW